MEENLIDRIGDEYLNPNFQDGQILLNTDINEIVSVVKEGINANFNDIQKIQNGSLQVGNSSQLDGATLTKFSDGELEGADNKIPTAQLVKSYVDNKVQEVKDTTEVGQLVENLNKLGIEVGNKVDKEDLVSEETAGTDKAYNCDYINELFESGVGDSLPIGTIVEYDGNNIPDGFEEVVEPQDATVYVGPTEPTDGQDVWIQKGKNLFNKNDITYNRWLSEKGEPYAANEGDIVTSFIDVIPNKKYTISGLIAEQWLVVCGYDANKNFVAMVQSSTGSSGIAWTFEIPSNVAYIRCAFSRFDCSTTVIQIEQGSTATDYEPFIRKIYIKNDNGIYEEFSQAFKVEEGSWTPTIGARNETPPTTTYDYRRGYYKKIGKMVYVEFYLEGKITALNGTNNYSTVDGLPFPVHNDNLFGQSCLHLGSYYDMLSNADTQLTLIASGSKLYVQAMHGASAGRLKITNYFMISGSGWYMID